MVYLMLNDRIPDDELENLLGEMFYELLVKHKNGKTYCRVLEHLLMKPVFIFGKDVHLSSGFEGRNEFIRRMFNWANAFMTQPLKDKKIKKVQRTLKNPALPEDN